MLGPLIEIFVTVSPCFEISNILDFCAPSLQTIPEALAGLSGLRSLNLRSNKLRALADSVGLLTSLTFLDVSSNDLHDLPATLGRCRQVSVLLLL